MKRRMSQQQGFTLLELLMVVIIIGILASVALPQYTRVAERSRAAEALTNLAALRSAELRFKAANPDLLYTTDPAQLDIDVPGFNGVVVSPNWTFGGISGTGAGSSAVATRTGGVHVGQVIRVFLDTGALCADNGDWAVANVATPCG